MKFIISLMLCLFMVSTVVAQEPNPRLKNFRYGTGKASWWENKPSQPAPQPRFQTYYYPPAVRYYTPRPYYGHYHYCHCNHCVQRRMMYQLQVNPQRFFFFQFRF